MALDLSAVMRTVGGVCLAHALDERTPVDGVAKISEYVVVGNPNYATLVTGPEQDILQRLRDGGEHRAALLGAVYVTSAQTPELCSELAAHGMTAIVGTRIAGVALHATLASSIANDRAAADRLVTAGMNVLTQVARRGGTTAVIAELARRIDGWAVLLDPQSQVIASAGAGRLHISDAIAVATGRPVRVRHHGLQLHQVGTDRDISGRLIVATRSTRTSHARDLASLAAALFDLLLRTHDPSLTEHLGREALIKILLAGGAEATELLHRWGVHEHQLVAFELGSKTRTIDAEPLLSRWFNELGAEHVFTTARGQLSGFVREDVAPQLASRVENFAPVAGSRLHLGLGNLAPIDRLVRSAGQATQAFEAALVEGSPVVAFSDLATVDLVFSAIGGRAASSIAGALDALCDAQGELDELGVTLQVFLGELGAHRKSAERLGIHRQTLLSRLRRIEELTGLALDRVDDRTAAWIALRARAAR